MKRERSRAVAGDAAGHLADDLTGGWAEVHAWFADVCDKLAHRAASARIHPADAPSPEAAAAALFRLLSAREFTYLTRCRYAAYRPMIEGYLRRVFADGGAGAGADIGAGGGPARFYYDIGGGYRASLRPGVLPLSFAPGLADLLVLHQIRAFTRRALECTPAPIRFTLVVDNLCAHFVNGIPLESTRRYCAALRDILRHFGFDDVDLLVESERIEIADYERQFDAALATTTVPGTITTPAWDNVERFIGRPVDARRARLHLARYAAGSIATEAGLAPIVDGIRMTQRATPATPAFRAFPGSDVRIQCGEVGLALGANGRIRPLLLSSVNYARYRQERIDIAEWRIPHIEALRFLY